ncbi:MAG: S1C family serine protease [Actinomycetota bacterium]|nr:S1C family serine protease [Actinomycetota bacterium]
MFDVHRLPSSIVAATFALSGIVAGTGVTSVALGAGQGSSVPCPDVDDDKPAGDILDCVGPSTAFIETPTSSGSGLVLADGYVLTNAHVVDPFEKVDLTIQGEKLTDVPVIGVDLFKDIAVLGPVETDAEPVELVDPSHLEKGADLFLVGYPGQANDEDLEATVADGILSRTRTSKTFGLTYLQTDASIGGGQSGGALVDIDGNIVGISSLRFAENFALALSSADAQLAVDQILAGKGTANASWPGGVPATNNAVALTDDYSAGMLAFESAPEDRTVDVTMPADQPIILLSTTVEEDEPLEFGANLLAVGAEEAGVPYSQIAGVQLSPEEEREILMEELGEDEVTLAYKSAPGQFQFKIPAGEHFVLVLLTNREGGTTVPVTTSLPAAYLSPDAVQTVNVGDEIDGTVTSLMPYDAFEMHLDEGQSVQIYAGSPSGDMAVMITEPGQDPEDATEFDDSRAGLYGVDVDETYEAPATGTYRIEVGTMEDIGTGYRFSITAA